MKRKSSQKTDLSGKCAETDKSHNLLVSFNPMASGLKQFGDQWSQAAQALRKRIEQISEEASKLVQQSIEQTAKEIRTAIDNLFLPISEVLARIRDIDPAFLEAVKQKLEHIVSDSKQVHSKLAQRVWFLIASEQYVTASDMLSLTLLVETEDLDKIDAFMAQWVETKLPAIQEILIEKYPARREILERAFQAHNTNDYILSIPVFLAQADGIWIDLTNRGSVYSKRDGKPRSRHYIDSDDMNIQMELLYLLEPFRMITPLIQNHEQVDSCLLNRHAVLHGRSCDYGTKLNSLKAISWLLYVGTFKDVTQD
jgi:hypothetical protein